MPELTALPSWVDWFWAILGSGIVVSLPWSWYHIQKLNIVISLAAFVMAILVTIGAWDKLSDMLLLTKAPWVIWVEALTWTGIAIVITVNCLPRWMALGEKPSEKDDGGMHEEE